MTLPGTQTPFGFEVHRNGIPVTDTDGVITLSLIHPTDAQGDPVDVGYTASFDGSRPTDTIVVTNGFGTLTTTL